jgi:hypothetical protein
MAFNLCKMMLFLSSLLNLVGLHLVERTKAHRQNGCVQPRLVLPTLAGHPFAIQLLRYPAVITTRHSNSLRGAAISLRGAAMFPNCIASYGGAIHPHRIEGREFRTLS